ncbi:hypothetical protein G8T75_12825 [Clostridium botulinum D/C]|uniref:hypothetical protein n=1 Tax=Clostridium botulinum TaxID=1491 RepID=UPI001E3C4F39|nr:hypothetical protein [Clostridium botulinum]MCD3240841.1 hypothetical protein [Clostridium botulinum D/C]
MYELTQTDITNILKLHQQRIGRELTRRHLQTLRKYINNLNKTDNSVIGLDMGKGKSMVLLEYVNYMVNKFPTWSCIVVKETIEQAKDFIIELGLKDKRYENILCSDYINWETLNRKEMLTKYYDGKITNRIESGKYTGIESAFIGRLLRGFQKKYCKINIKYDDCLGKAKEQKEYSPDVCLKCKEFDCPTFKAKLEFQKHQVVVVTHARLFLTSSESDFLDDLKYYKDINKKKHLRQHIFIDEKFNFKDNSILTINDYNDVLGIITKIDCELEHNINAYINTLEFPTLDGKHIEVKPFDKNFAFDTEILRQFMNSTEQLEKIIALQKFLRYGGTTSRYYKDNSKQLGYVRVINYKTIADTFDKFNILDATSLTDIDYIHTSLDVISLNTTKLNINLYYDSEVNLSKSKLVGVNSTIDNITIYNKNIKNIALDLQEIINKYSKTLIVCYRNFVDIVYKEYSFMNDLDNELNKLETKGYYEFNYFGNGELKGSNKYMDFDNIIIMGQLIPPLDKLTLDRITYNKQFKTNINNNNIKWSKLIVDNIQLIGRSCCRKGEKANIYMLGVEEEVIKGFDITNKKEVKQILGIKDWFKTRVIKYNMQNYKNNKSNIRNSNNLWFQIKEYLNDNLKEQNDMIHKENLSKKFNVSWDSIRQAFSRNKRLKSYCQENNIRYIRKLKSYVKVK